MSELRQDQTTREWVIIAPERAKRPHHKPKKKPEDSLPNWDASCPFCPGNEVKTPFEVMRIPASGKDSDWDVRVIPNKFAALTPDGSTTVMEEGHFFHRMGGFGAHEVIIESPSHNIPIALMPYQQVEKVLAAYQQRYNALKKNRQLKHITIFKNHGREAGTSLAHPHSQLVATPIATTYYRRKFDIAFDFYNDTGRCLYCDLLAEELEKGERVVAETSQFVILHPFASRVPWETWIIPRTHYASFGLHPQKYLGELAMVLKDILLCLYRGLDNPALNFMIDTTTTQDEEDPYYHWHIRIVPRLTRIAGFEMGSGIYINSALPEQTARLMKQSARSLPPDECPTLKIDR